LETNSKNEAGFHFGDYIHNVEPVISIQSVEHLSWEKRADKNEK